MTFFNRDRKGRLRKANANGDPSVLKENNRPPSPGPLAEPPAQTGASKTPTAVSALERVMDATHWLFDAIYHRDLDAAEETLANGADPNAFEPVKKGGRMMIGPGMYANVGATPLIIAITAKNKAMVELLLANGADPNLAITHENITPLRAARDAVLPEMEELLIKHGAK